MDVTGTAPYDLLSPLERAVHFLSSQATDADAIGTLARLSIAHPHSIKATYARKKLSAVCTALRKVGSEMASISATRPAVVTSVVDMLMSRASKLASNRIHFDSPSLLDHGVHSGSPDPGSLGFPDHTNWAT